MKTNFLIKGTPNKIITDSRNSKTLLRFDEKGEYITDSLYIAGVCSRKFKVVSLDNKIITEDEKDKCKMNIGDEVRFMYNSKEYKAEIAGINEDGSPIFTEAVAIEEENKGDEEHEEQEELNNENEDGKTSSEDENKLESDTPEDNEGKKEFTREELEEKDINELRKIASERELNSQGKKVEIIDRILA